MFNAPVFPKKCLLLFLLLSFGNLFSQTTADSLEHTNALKNLTVEDFTQRVNKGLVLVYLKADWCAICKKQKPIIDDVFSTNKNNLTLLVIDTKENPLINDHFEVDGLPLLYLYKDGKIVWSRIGLTDKQLLLEQIKFFLR